MHEDRLIETVDLGRARHLADPLRRLLGPDLLGDLALGRSLTRELARGGWRAVRLVPRREGGGPAVAAVDLFGTAAGG